MLDAAVQELIAGEDSARERYAQLVPGRAQQRLMMQESMFKEN